ncbi:TPA: fimbrial protein [Stenotrophomonas maltophilia]
MEIHVKKAHYRRRLLRNRCVWIALGLLASASAVACTGQSNTGTPVNLVIEAWDDAEQGKMVANWQSGSGANAMFLIGCAYMAVVPMDVTSSLPGLEFVRNVNLDGQSYPAFGLIAYPRSPLLIFRHQIWTGTGNIRDDYVPLDIRGTVHFPSKGFDSNGRGSIVQVAAISRGGIMQPVPSTLLGPISRVSPLYPQWVKSDTFTVTANLKVPTCKLSDTPVALVDVGVADLPASGRVAGERTFDVAMECNGAFPVEMVLTDANLPGNSGSRLTPTAKSTAGAVRVELLQEGAPVVLGRPWTIPLTQNGRQNITLAARYYRETGAFHGGVVEGQAVITATYR